MMKYILLFLALLLSSGCERPKGFTLKKILSKHAADPRWDTPPLSLEDDKKLTTLLSRPFYYLSSGNHCYAFASEDGEYVLKFFKQKHMHKRPFMRPSVVHRREQEREKSFTSYKIAFEKLKEDTALFYLHLNKTSHLDKQVTLIDQHGHPIKIDIDKMEFLIQKKGKLVFNHLDYLLKHHRDQEALDSIDSLLQLIVTRKQKGIFDRDLQFYKNFGFIGNRAIKIDIGDFCIDPSQNKRGAIQAEILTVSTQLTSWIEAHYPHLSPQVQDLLTHE